MPSAVLYTLSLHDALPICCCGATSSRTSCARSSRRSAWSRQVTTGAASPAAWSATPSWSRATRRGSRTWCRPTSAPPSSGSVRDRKSTRLNSSHRSISYAVRRALHSFPTRRSSDLLLRSDLIEDQLRQVIEEVGLEPPGHDGSGLTRCLECNAELEPRDKARVAHLVPPYVRATQQRFSQRSEERRVGEGRGTRWGWE